jgi:hypothetical protein
MRTELECEHGRQKSLLQGMRRSPYEHGRARIAVGSPCESMVERSTAARIAGVA